MEKTIKPIDNIEEPVIAPIAIEKTDAKEAEMFLQTEFTKPLGCTVIKVKYLWDSYFRVNFFGEKNPEKGKERLSNFKDNYIMASLFVRVLKTKKGKFIASVLGRD